MSQTLSMHQIADTPTAHHLFPAKHNLTHACYPLPLLTLARNTQARAEAYEIAQTSHQYIVPTDGSPLRGLIQDNVGNGVLLTKRDTFLTRDMYQQLIMGCAHNIRNGSAHMQFHTPAILKPKVLYTGKQVISTLLDMLMFDPEFDC